MTLELQLDGQQTRARAFLITIEKNEEIDFLEIFEGFWYKLSKKNGPLKITLSRYVCQFLTALYNHLHKAVTNCEIGWNKGIFLLFTWFPYFKNFSDNFSKRLLSRTEIDFSDQNRKTISLRRWKNAGFGQKVINLVLKKSEI